MKKILIILTVVLMFVSCQNEVAKPAYELDDIKPEPIIKVEKSTYYIHDEIFPNYLLLTNYPDDALIDWNEDTEVYYEKYEPLRFTFEKEESIHSFEIVTADVERIKIIYDDLTEQSFTVESCIVLETPKLTQSFSVVIEEPNGGTLQEFHVIGHIETDQTTYEYHQNKEAVLNRINATYNWQKDPFENILTVQSMVESIGKNTLLQYSKQVDFERLEAKVEDVTGYPVQITGQVTSVEAFDDHFLIVVDALIYEAPLIVVTKTPIEENIIFDMTGVLLGYNEHLVFYGLK